jgi:hypothetical protein
MIQRGEASVMVRKGQGQRPPSAPTGPRAVLARVLTRPLLAIPLSLRPFLSLLPICTPTHPFPRSSAQLAGASESSLSAISLVGFARLKALSTGFTGDRAPQASRPFDADRDGFVMGEGAACLVLEDLEHARARGATAYAEVRCGRCCCCCFRRSSLSCSSLPPSFPVLLPLSPPSFYSFFFSLFLLLSPSQVRGYGMSGDGHHVTQPHPGGRGAILCMERALKGSGISKESIAYINAHATSTPQGEHQSPPPLSSLTPEKKTGLMC